jgi:hypothetical protein
MNIVDSWMQSAGQNIWMINNATHIYPSVMQITIPYHPSIIQTTMDGIMSTIHPSIIQIPWMILSALIILPSSKSHR